MSRYIIKCFRCPVDIRSNLSEGTSTKNVMQTTNQKQEQNSSQPRTLSENEQISTPQITNFNDSSDMDMTTEKKQY